MEMLNPNMKMLNPNMGMLNPNMEMLNPNMKMLTHNPACPPAPTEVLGSLRKSSAGPWDPWGTPKNPGVRWGPPP